MTYLPENKSDMKLVSSTLLKIENNVAVYVVTYQVKEKPDDKDSKWLDKSLATMSADIVGIKGYKFDKLLYTYYAKGSSGTINAVVTVSFKDSLGSFHKENFELVVKKNGDTWFVKTSTHGVSQNYFKVEKEK